MAYWCAIAHHVSFPEKRYYICKHLAQGLAELLDLNINNTLTEPHTTQQSLKSYKEELSHLFSE